MTVGRYWHPLSSKIIQCDLCPRQCHLKEGQRGVCVVRGNHQGQLQTETYGRTCGLCIDPIEKKPLYHFFPGSRVFSFGTVGCNLVCEFCQNWHLSRSEAVPHGERQTPQKLVSAAKANGCRSVAFTYNEPVVFIEYALDVARACREQGIKTVAVTNGYIAASARSDFFSVIDAANVDLKAFSDDFYRKLCGAASLQPVLDTLLYIKKHTAAWLEITTLLIPDANDSDSELNAMTQWIVNALGPDIPIHFSAFHPAYRMLSKPRTPVETLIRARQIALKNGMKYVYIGNVIDGAGTQTYCPHCKKSVIQRAGYQILQDHIERGNCSYCGCLIPGFF